MVTAGATLDVTSRALRCVTKPPPATPREAETSVGANTAFRIASSQEQGIDTGKAYFTGQFLAFTPVKMSSQLCEPEHVNAGFFDSSAQPTAAGMALT